MRLFFLIAVLTTSSLARADAPPRTSDAHQMHTDDCARARKQNKTCVIDMGKGDDIEATSATAGGSAIGLIEFGKAASLIHIRRDFIVEIIKTAEDL